MTARAYMWAAFALSLLCCGAKVLAFLTDAVVHVTAEYFGGPGLNLLCRLVGS